ncbi:epimerase [alpha proteobacterium AAP81b]|nr:epimerase [alpha proteobacterium AAP81b]
MSEEILVLGYGAVGRAVVAQLLAEGRHLRVAQRSRPADLPPAVPFTPCDLLDAGSVAAAMAGAAQIVVAIGFPYDGKTWAAAWPRAMANLVAGAEAAGARVVFLDNLYMYGAQTAPLREDMALTSVGAKPAARAAATRVWQAATHRVRFAALRAPDFYGPGVTLSQLGDLAFGALARGKAAQLIVPADTPHDFAYVPDIARALVLLLDAPDSDFGQIWHMPSAPTQTLRQILTLGADAIGARPRVFVIPSFVQPLLGLFVPMLREMREMHFQWDRPYHVDARRFTARFGFVPAPFAVGAAATARSFVGSAPKPVMGAAVAA